MARHKPALKENQDRWLVSYADLLTLLFAFFVVMFASTQTDHVRAKQISEAVQEALKPGSTSSRGTQKKGDAAVAGVPPVTDLTAAERLLRGSLQKEVAAGSVEIRAEERGLIISLNSAIFFSQGDDTIDPFVYPTLSEVADILNSLPNALRFEGHTDSVPIKTARFPSNWELSAARSIAMLRLFKERYGVARERLAIVGYADTVALDSNETAVGQRRNRRVDIVIVSESGLRVEPHSPASAVASKTAAQHSVP